MKQNTKFLWMYVGILFSFALILIIFAGLSSNSDIEQREGLKDDIAALSAQNTSLKNENTSLKEQLASLTEENTALKSNDVNFANVEAVLARAAEFYEDGDEKQAKAELATINPADLTQSQSYIYNMIN